MSADPDLRAMLEKATPLPWPNLTATSANNKADARLLVAAVNALPSLLDEIEALREALKPFAAVADSFDKASFPVDDSAKLYASFSGDITIGHMRKARLALQTPEGK